uniref:Uncharacterized protein n=1 Tax=Rhizophora mucronata TaxID=61149 RepID=A0A2P2PMJ1_RHIMU
MPFRLFLSLLLYPFPTPTSQLVSSLFGFHSGFEKISTVGRVLTRKKYLML